MRMMYRMLCVDMRGLSGKGRPCDWASAANVLFAALEGYAKGGPLARSRAVKEKAKQAAGFGLPPVFKRGEGKKVLGVLETTKR